MRIVITDVILKHSAHRSVIRAVIKPNWFEKFFIGNRPVAYTGHGTKWDVMPEMTEVKPKLAKQLQAVEKRWIFVKQSNPNMNFQKVAAEINKHFK
jgi:hypothetical protein